MPLEITINPAEVLLQARRHQQAGEFAQAIALLGEILRVDARQVEALHLLGVILHQLGDAAAAIELFSQALEAGDSHPLAAELHTDLGSALKARGQGTKAEASVRRALELRRDDGPALLLLGRLLEGQCRWTEARIAYGDAWHTASIKAEALVGLGNVERGQGRIALACEQYKKAMHVDAAYAPAYMAFGDAQVALGEFEAAITSYLRVAALDPRFPEVDCRLGDVYTHLKRYSEGAEAYQRSLTLWPGLARAYNNFGLLLMEMNQQETALKLFERAAAVDPAYASPHANMGRMFCLRGDAMPALEHTTSAIALNPNLAGAHTDQGSAREMLGDLAAAVASFQRAYDLAPEIPVHRRNLAVALSLQGDERGIRSLKRLIREQPDDSDLHLQLGVGLLLRGEYARGWKEYEWRLKPGEATVQQILNGRPKWRGEPLAGKTLFLLAEQGFGDTLQFARYIPLIAQRGARIVIRLQPGLKRLMCSFPGVAECRTQDDPFPKEFDFHCSLMSLPGVFKTTLASIPPVVPLQPLLGVPGRHGYGSVAVGLVWAGSPKHQRDGRRSLRLKQLRPLLDVPSCSFVSLQRGDAAGQVEEEGLGARMATPCAAANDFYDTAVVIAGLDLVVTVDTAVAHLAAGMGKPVWMLISGAPDWRWGLQGETTPWYPTIRLFRKSSGEDWSGVVATVASQLAVFSKNYAAGLEQDAELAAAGQCA